MQNESETEWVTIAEAARRMGIDVRQARRYADKLIGTEDRTGQDTVPSRVLLSSMVSLREKNSNLKILVGHRTGQGMTGQDTVLKSVLPHSNDSAPSFTETDVLKSELERLQSEREKDAQELTFLRTQLEAKDKQLEAHTTAESELRRLMLLDRQELQELRQRLALPSAESETGKDPQTKGETAQKGFWERLRTFWKD